MKADHVTSKKCRHISLQGVYQKAVHDLLFFAIMRLWNRVELRDVLVQLAVRKRQKPLFAYACRNTTSGAVD